MFKNQDNPPFFKAAQHLIELKMSRATLFQWMFVLLSKTKSTKFLYSRASGFQGDLANESCLNLKDSLQIDQ